MGDASPGGHGVALLDRQGGDGARAWGQQRLLHLHGLEDGHELTFLHLVSLGDGQRDDDRLHGSNDVAGSALVRACLNGGGTRATRGRAQRLGRTRGRGGRRVEHACRQGQRHAAPIQLDDVGLTGQVGRRRGLGGHSQIRVVVLGHERRLEPSRGDVEAAHAAEVRIVDDVLVDGHRGGNALHRELGQRTARPGEGLLAVRASHDDLGDHGIERGLDGVALIDAQLEADAGAQGPVHLIEAASRGGQVLRRVFGRHAELEGVAARLRGSGQRQALRDTDLLAHQVDARDFFGHGVLDLQTRVDLEEPDVAVRLEQELHRAHAHVVDVLEQSARRVHERLVRPLGQEGGWCLFDQLLVATLHRAVTGRDDVEVAQRIARRLRLHVTSDLDETLDEVSAQVGGVRVTREEQVEVSLRADDADASSATAVGALEHHGVPSRGDEFLDLLARGHGLGNARDRSYAAGLGYAAGFDLVAQRVDDGRSGTEPRDTGILDGACKLGVLRQEAVAGMNRIRTRLQCDC